jgi:hypothetical protein
MARVYRTISADSHLEIGPDRWRDRVPEQYRERAPRLIQLPNGGEAVFAEGQPLRPIWAHNAGIPWEEWGYDNTKHIATSPGAGSADQRLRELDVDGVDAEVLYPGLATPTHTGPWCGRTTSSSPRSTWAPRQTASSRSG